MNRKLVVESRFHFFYCYDWPIGEEDSKDDDERQKGGLRFYHHQRPPLCSKSFSFSWAGLVSSDEDPRLGWLDYQRPLFVQLRET